MAISEREPVEDADDPRHGSLNGQRSPWWPGGPSHRSPSARQAGTAGPARSPTTSTRHEPCGRRWPRLPTTPAAATGLAKELGHQPCRPLPGRPAMHGLDHDDRARAVQTTWEAELGSARMGWRHHEQGRRGSQLCRIVAEPGPGETITRFRPAAPNVPMASATVARRRSPVASTTNRRTPRCRLHLGRCASPDQRQGRPARQPPAADASRAPSSRPGTGRHR